MPGPTQFRQADGGSTQFTHYNAGGNVGEGHGLRHGKPRAQRCRKYCNYSHAVFAASDQNSVKVELLHQGLALFNQYLLACTVAYHSLKLMEIRSYNRRASITFEVTTLRIDHHR